MPEGARVLVEGTDQAELVQLGRTQVVHEVPDVGHRLLEDPGELLELLGCGRGA